MKVYIFTRPSSFGAVGEVVKVVGATTPVGADLDLTKEEISAIESLGWKVQTTSIIHPNSKDALVSSLGILE